VQGTFSPPAIVLAALDCYRRCEFRERQCEAIEHISSGAPGSRRTAYSDRHCGDTERAHRGAAEAGTWAARPRTESALGRQESLGPIRNPAQGHRAGCPAITAALMRSSASIRGSVHF
jgi:hypothetical protein